jgi:DNA repair exonuclease SbcCD ATPase subunit
MKTIDEQLEAALARVKHLETDAQASTALLSEAGRHSDDLRAQLAAFKKESDDLTLANQELTEQRDQFSRDLATAKQSLQSATQAVEELAKAKQQITTLTAEVETLKANAKTAERIAAERYGAASEQPLPVTPRGDAKASELVARFKAISDPKEQTVFWRSLTPEQQTLVLNAK